MPSFTSPPAQPAPALNIPPSERTVKVSIIDTTTRIDGIATSMFFQPKVGEHSVIRCPAYSFLIENEGNGEKILFDLGVRKDWKKMAKPVVDRIESLHWQVAVEKDVADVLQENDVPPESISAVVYSHWHWDHVGDLSTFPTSTKLVVGPGFKARFIPGYPVNPEAPINDSHFTGREVQEVSPPPAGAGGDLVLGRFQALDYFGDGSFYLLFSPGHTADHMCGLARTTASPDSYIFMSADAVHHAGEHRPSPHVPLPAQIAPDPLQAYAQGLMSACPGDMFYEMHPKRSATEPFYLVSSGEDLEQARASVRKLIEFDGHDNVLCVMAHDQSLLDVLEFFPQPANDWKAKGWREKGMWEFLRQFVDSNA